LAADADARCAKLLAALRGVRSTGESGATYVLHKP